MEGKRMTTLDDLISRVREAREGSRELDHDITLLLLPEGTLGRGSPGYPNGPSSSLDAAVDLCERVLPGWWWRIGTCSVSDDATIGPDYNSPVHGERLHREFPCVQGSEYDYGFDVDQRPPRSVPLALTLAILLAVKANREK